MKTIISLIALLLILSSLSGLIFAPIKLNIEEFEQQRSFREQMMQKDKLLHVGCSFLITTGGFMYGQSNGFNRNDSKTIGVGLGTLTGLGKEYYDTKKKPPSGWSWHDLIADGFGIISAVGLIEISK